MTDSATTATAARIAAFEAACQAQGLPVTIQRRRVFEAILKRLDHPTADQLYDSLKPQLPGLSRTTVYRILDTLVQIGVVTRISHPGSVTRYDPRISQHHHLVCVHCEAVIDIEDSRLDQVPWPNVHRQGFAIQGCHVHFHGLCAKCREATAPPSRRPASAKPKVGPAGGRRKARPRSKR